MICAQPRYEILPIDSRSYSAICTIRSKKEVAQRHRRPQINSGDTRYVQKCADTPRFERGSGEYQRKITPLKKTHPLTTLIGRAGAGRDVAGLRLRELGIGFTPIAETPICSVIVFRDPDNIQLEFWLSAGQ
jgi:hypothetical protein